ASGLLLVAESVLGIGALYLLKLVVDVVTKALDSSEQSAAFEGVALFIGLTAAVTIAHVLVRALSGLISGIHSEIVADHVTSLIHDKAVELDLAFYESPAYYDTLQRAQQGGSSRPANVVTNITSIAQNTLMVAAIAGLLFSVHWMLVPVLLCAVIPGLIVRIRYTGILYQWQRKRATMEREAAYLHWLLTADLHTKEMRIFHLGDFLKRRFNLLRAHIRRERFKITTRRTLIEILINATGTAAFFACLGYLAYLTINGDYTTGDLVMFFVVFQRGQGLLQGLMSNLSRLYEDSLYISNLFELFDLERVIIDPVKPASVMRPMQRGILLDKVSFRYPGMTHDALTNIHMEIPAGKVVAIVGENGSGKTTLIKLLCRLYDPTKGSITMDDVDIKCFLSDEYRREFSVIFQDYARYMATAGENIRFGDITLPKNHPRILAAAKSSDADAFINKLARGYDTMLGKLFEGGQDISGGQWQRIALARAFVRASQVIILDEPTSALDATTEYEIFRQFRDLIEDRAAIIISHRLSTIRLADCIYVLHQGRIIESGTHDELIARQGMYQQLFDKQSFFYRD
ncbi:MAG: ABC transporter ATP-binding protein, partial [Candidatus Competibacteraceae bacterium]|nr:ABC transporter ATP-binding protein [Candidatus Competibacteraceae bacterium]